MLGACIHIFTFKPLTALQFSNKFSANGMPSTILSAWDMSMNKKQDRYIPLFLDEMLKLKDPKQLA